MPTRRCTRSSATGDTGIDSSFLGPRLAARSAATRERLAARAVPGSWRSTTSPWWRSPAGKSLVWKLSRVGGILIAAGFLRPSSFRLPRRATSSRRSAHGSWTSPAARRAPGSIRDSTGSALWSISPPPRQFRQPNILESILTSVARNHLEPRHLVIELTESAVMRDADRSVESPISCTARAFGSPSTISEPDISR